MTTTNTFTHPFVTITRDGDSTRIRADEGALSDWASRPGSRWPCSALANLHGISVDLQRGDLVDLVCWNEAGEVLSGEDERVTDLTADELNAFIADATGRDHRDGH